ncbi:MAG: 2Fe-2S iron-sulfur cluster-binding protein [Bryobacteraceae bacterium]
MENGEGFLVVLETPEGQRSFVCHRDEFVWNAAARNGTLLPSICHQGRCLTCAGRLLSGAVDQSSANSFYPEDKRAGFVLLCTAQPRSELHVRTHQQWAMREHRAKLGLPAPYL